MSENTLSRDKLRDLMGLSTYLGTDADGNDHYWYSTRRTAWVVGDGAVRYQQRVEDLSDYVGHVDDVAGWTYLQYDSRSLEELVGDLVEAAS